MDAEFRTAPKSRILRNIDDMGKFLAEYHGNSAYWLQVISSRFCGGCALFMIAMLPFFCYSVLVKAAHLNPGEIPDYFYPTVWGGMVGLPGVMLLFFMYAIRQNGKNPLHYGVFEKGFVVVLRNKTVQRILRNDIERIRITTHHSLKPRILGIVVALSSQETQKKKASVYVSADFFRHGEELCRRIIDFATLAEKTDRPLNTKRRFVLFGIVIVVAAVFLFFIERFGKYMDSRGTVSTNWQIISKMTGETMHFSVYLPPGYHHEIKNGRRYPVLYLLHGFRDDHTSWLQHGKLCRIADETIRSGKTVPMVIIMPHALGGFYGNRSDGRYRYEDYFFTELIPFVENRFQVNRDKEHRAIAGISMGGQGAFYYAMKYPEWFASCCTMGGAFNFTDLKNLRPDSERIRQKNNKNDLCALLLKTSAMRTNADPATYQKMFVRFFLDCGEQDGLININRELDAKMTELHIPHEFRTRPGGHAWECWHDALPEVLEFANETFY